MPELSHRARIGFRRPGSGPLAAVARKLRAISSVLCKSCQSWAAQATSPLSGIGPWLTAAGDGKPSAACGTGSAESRAALWNGLTTRWPARNRVGGPERPRPHGRRPRRARPGSRRGACGFRAQTNAGHPATPRIGVCVRPRASTQPMGMPNSLSDMLARLRAGKSRVPRVRRWCADAEGPADR